MLFASLHFFVFFVLVVLTSAALRKYKPRAEILFLVLASAYFYGQWSWAYLILIYVTIITDFYLGLRCYNSKNPRGFLLLSMVVNLGILVFFKYANFLIDSSNRLLQLSGFDWSLTPLDFLLPVGISFYTFQSMSYTIDIFRGELRPRTSFLEYALFVSFFPQLVAGPIVRAKEFFQQLDGHRRFTFDMAQSGFLLMLIGLVKKTVFADNLALVADPVFNQPAHFDSLATLLAVYAFAFQIYFDFSGYTDMAIGAAKFLGFSFPKNFDHPYVSRSIQDFWRRWHMTLSRWLRDYLYISLGGNRQGRWKTSRNLFLTMFLGGLWHGASWNFAIWGTLHGLFLAGEKQLRKPLASGRSIDQWLGRTRLGRGFQWLVTFNLVCLAWIFFRSDSLANSLLMLEHLFVWNKSGRFVAEDGLTIMVLAGFFLAHFLGHRWQLADRSGQMRTPEFVGWSVLMLLLLIGFAVRETTAFIYFQF
jgi:D-alanyl-lipoteichoic acid acyltransferase DltB (MBOAT superfamily)